MNNIALSPQEVEDLLVVLPEYIRNYEPSGPADREDRRFLASLRRLLKRLRGRS